MKPDYKELERQLAESRREFWAADATINNLELKLEEMAAQLANAENKRREIAAENEAIKFYLRNGPVVRKGGELVAAHQFSPETPATDAFLAEVRAQAFNDLCAAFVKDAKVIGLDDGDIVTVKEATDALLHCAEQLRKGDNQ